MHVVEHVGLGRYSDPIDSIGDLKAIAELKRILAPGGSLYFVVPVGKPKMMFNAHRVYSYRMIIEYFFELVLKEFSLVKDDGQFLANASETTSDMQRYGCGCFWFQKQ
jgi:SAM-dependent methyltransferase